MVNESNQEKSENLDLLTCIHWGYLNVLQLHDVSGKKIKHPRWQTFWTDLCGSTLRFYKDTTLPDNNKLFPPATVIGPRPEDQIKYSFFSLKNGSVKDYDAMSNSPKLRRKNKIGRKNVLQITLANFSVYYLQAPTMSAFYRWRTKLQSSIDSAEAPERFYEKQLREAKMELFELHRCHVKVEPQYPETDSEVKQITDKFSSTCNPRLRALQDKLMEKENFLKQLEKQERDFLGNEDESKSTLTRIEFTATAGKRYFLVIGRRDTLICKGESFTVFGRLPNERWRCYVERKERLYKSDDGKVCENFSYPLIGSVPSSVIVELNQPSRIKDLVDSLSVSSGDMSPPGTPPDDLSTSVIDGVLTPPRSQSPRRISDASSFKGQHSRLEPYSTHRRNSKLEPPKHSANTSLFTRPKQPQGTLPLCQRVPRSSTLSISPTSPYGKSIDNAITDLNLALSSLNALKQRPRASSDVSIRSQTSNSSQEYESPDMSRISKIELYSDDGDTTVRRRKKRDIHISRKLHAKGISIIVGSSSSSEDEDEGDKVDGNLEQRNQLSDSLNEVSKSRTIEGLQTSKEKLAEKVVKGVKCLPEIKQPTKERPVVDNMTITTDLLQEFSENGCYGEPIRNSVTQSQFKPLASHEISPPLHQRRTLQMTRKENEGFGFVLQTSTVIQTDAYSDTMTYISNVSEDGPAYLAGMRPGDVIMEIDNMKVEDEPHHMIVGNIKNAGLSVRLVVVYKEAIKRMKMSTRLIALKARLKQAEAAYEDVIRKEQVLLDHFKGTQITDAKIRSPVVYIHSHTSSTTFARETAEIKNSVNQVKRTPLELLEAQKQSTERSKYCGVSTTSYELVREFATTCEPENKDGFVQKSTSSKFTSDSTINSSKGQSEVNFKQKTFRQLPHSSFISYLDFDQNRFGVKKEHDSVPSTRKRLVPDCDDESKYSVELDDELRPKKNISTSQTQATRPESYKFALGSQNAIDSNLDLDSKSPIKNFDGVSK